MALGGEHQPGRRGLILGGGALAWGRGLALGAGLVLVLRDALGGKPCPPSLSSSRL